MRRPPVRIRTFILGTVLALLLLPTLSGGAAWLIERNHQQADTRRRLDTALAYLTSHRTEIEEPAAVQGFARLLGRLDLLGQLVIAGPSEKSQLYISPALNPTLSEEQARKAKARRSGTTAADAPAGASASWADDRQLIPVPASKARATLEATLITDLY